MTKVIMKNIDFLYTIGTTQKVGSLRYRFFGKFIKSRISLKKWLLFFVSIVGVALVIFFLALGLPVYGAYSSSTLFINNKISQSLMNDNLIKSVQSIISVKQAVQLTNKTSLGLPMRLKIPRINVDAPIKSVGITSQGAMDAPKGPTDTVWFNLGPRPGESGSAVIAGHFGPWKNGKGSVFDNLYKLKKGDKLYIKDEKGIMITFVVRESRKYNPNADASDVFGSSDDKAHLNLITCEGVWDKIRKTYSNRLIVFTDREIVK